MFANTALVNVATFSGVNGSIDLGTFDGRASAANPDRLDPPAWTSVLKQGLDLLKQTFQSQADAQGGTLAQAGDLSDAHSQGSASTTGSSDWVVVARDNAKAAAQGAGNLQGSVKVDWKDLSSGFAEPFLSKGSAASRTPQQPNIAEFKAPAPNKHGQR